MYEPVNLGTNISTRKSTKQDYSGPKDEKTGLNEGIGSIIYDFDNYIQSYEGKFIWNNMHGYGEYKWESLRSTYEGQFYANKKEGYGRFSYPSGAYFEGLYRNDRRFGPGIFTDAAGYQDVGIWVASKLIRLSRCFEPDDAMPRLAVRNEDKIRILQYRKIVNLQKDVEKHVAENVLESLTQGRNYDESVIARAEELYDPFCKDARAASFNKPRYDRMFFVNGSDDQFTIDVILTEEKEIQQKISDEKQVLIQVESLTMRDDVPRIHESKITHDNMHDLENIRMDEEKLIDDKLNSDKKIALFENEGEKEDGEEESDYCGIKPIDLEKLNDPILKGNHENLWSIFQSSNIITLRDLPKTSDASLSNGDHIKKSESSEKISSGDEFDDFGRKKINGTKPLTKKVLVTGLLAWNNSSLLIELLKHVFKHRNFEKTLSFDINKILAGRRGSFRQEGAHEKAALELLEACSGGFQSKISKLILRQNVNPDVADSRGNTGLLLAAVGDKLEAIETLLNLGANIDIINDECLTPLSLCILRLLELIHGVTDWSKAFLPNEINDESIVENKLTNLENYKQWHGRISCESLSQQMPKQMDRNHLVAKNKSTELGSDNVAIKNEFEIAKDTVNIGSVVGIKHVSESNAQVDKRKGMKKPGQNLRTKNNHDGSYNQKYIFEMGATTKASIPQWKMKNNPTKNKNNKIKIEISRDSKIKQKNILRESKQIQDDDPKIKKVRDTVSKLLTRGADPNFAQVPFPVLIMAIFTKIPSLLSELLEHGADPNTSLPKADHSLTSLLILTILQPAYENSLMAKELLKAKANPSLRADPSYRKDLMERLGCDRAPEYLDNSEGVTPLHILSIRVEIDTDDDEHLAALIEVFYKDGSIGRSDLYQGHSPLSLAIVEGKALKNSYNYKKAEKKIKKYGLLTNLIGAKRFLKTKFINVNEQLGADLGSAMLMLESSALQELLPPDLLQKFLELLLEYGGCPFSSANALGEEYNQIEYGRKELTNVLTKAESSVEAEEKKSKRKTKRSSKSSKETVMEQFTRSMDFVEKIAREKLIGRIRENFIKELLNSPVMLLPAAKQLSVFFKEPLFNYALNWMTEEDLAIVMKRMNCSRDNVTELVRLFVAARVLTQQKNSSDSNTLVQNETEKIIDRVMPSVDEKQQILPSANLKVEKTIGEKKRKNYEPELDLESKKFKVCFECFGVHRKILIACPKCKRLYFCSEKCNSKNTEREANPHQCPIFYQNEWTRAEKIATSSGIDATSYMLEKFVNPKKFMDLEEKMRRSKEREGKTGSSKYRDENTCSTKAKYRDDELPVYEKHGGSNYKTNRVNGGDQPADKVKYDYEREENSTNSSEAKESNTKTVHREDGVNMNNVKENNEDDDDDRTRSKNTSTKGHRLKIKNGIKKDVSDEKKSLQNAKKSGENKEKKPTNGRSVKVKNEKKNLYRLTNDEEVTRNETGTKSNGGDKNKNKESVIGDGKVGRTGSDGVKPKNGKKKGRRFDENELNENNSKFKVEKKNLRNKTRVQKPNEFRRNNNVIVKTAAERKREGSYKKREWDNCRNKRTRKRDSDTWKNKAAINITEIKNNRAQAKYLNWLLKVNKSLGERLDIDMFLLPYVVFAQGDTYFRMLPPDRFPKYKGNYSII